MKHFSYTKKKMKLPHHIFTIKNKSHTSAANEYPSRNEIRIAEEISTIVLIQKFQNLHKKLYRGV